MLEQQAPVGVDASPSSLRGDETNLYAQIDRDKIFGLNLADPGAAAVCIKPWDRRADMTLYTESGVDDQVRMGSKQHAQRPCFAAALAHFFFFFFISLSNPLPTLAHHYDPFHYARANQVDSGQRRARRLCTSGKCLRAQVASAQGHAPSLSNRDTNHPFRSGYVRLSIVQTASALKKWKRAAPAVAHLRRRSKPVLGRLRREARSDRSAVASPRQTSHSCRMPWALPTTLSASAASPIPTASALSLYVAECRDMVRGPFVKRLLMWQ